MDLRLLNKQIDPKNIEFRVQSISEKGYAIILPYKDARYDQKVLDEVVGPEFWQKDYKVVNGNLFCGISIYVPGLDQWVTKWDVGIESNEQAKKGEASDSFKRAGFCWGIGRELYDMPLILLHLNSSEFYIKDKGGKKIGAQSYGLNLKLWGWEFVRDENGKVFSIIARDENGNKRFETGQRIYAPKLKKDKPKESQKNENLKKELNSLKPKGKPRLKPGSNPFNQAVERLKSGTASIEKLIEHYTIEQSVLLILNKVINNKQPEK